MAPSEPVEVPREVPLVPRPFFALARVTTDPAWPLIKLPSLAPSYILDAANWTDLCPQRGRLPDDVLEYVLAWCQFREDRRFALAAVLARLRASMSPRLAEAARLDLAVVLADTHTGAQATAWLHGNANHDARVIDYLAAAYIELARIDDARHVVRHYARSFTPGETCGRAVNRVIVGFDPADIERLLDVAQQCGPAALEIACIAVNGLEGGFRAVPSSCTGVGTSEQLAIVRAFRAYLAWPSPPVGDQTWLLVAGLAGSSLEIAGMPELAVAALTNVAIKSCSQSTLEMVAIVARRMLAAHRHDPTDDARVWSLVYMSPAQCEALRADLLAARR